MKTYEWTCPTCKTMLWDFDRPHPDGPWDGVLGGGSHTCRQCGGQMECTRMLDERGLRPIPAIVALRLWERAFLYSCHFVLRRRRPRRAALPAYWAAAATTRLCGWPLTATTGSGGPCNRSTCGRWRWGGSYRCARSGIPGPHLRARRAFNSLHWLSPSRSWRQEPWRAPSAPDK